MKIVSVVGTRPQLIKAAALLPELRARHDVVLVDTGQHWDERMAGAFFAELGLPHPDQALGVGSGGHAAQTGRMLAVLEPVLEAEAPDAVLVYGDTNSTLAAAKLRIPVAHVEAGLRSFDRRMPEEINRVVADHLATWCFAPTPTTVENLAGEGITAGVVEVGDRPWLGTPCLVSLDGGRVARAEVVVGLDRALTVRALERLGPVRTSEALARARSETLDLRPTGAARRIVEALGPI